MKSEPRPERKELTDTMAPMLFESIFALTLKAAFCVDAYGVEGTSAVVHYALVDVC